MTPSLETITTESPTTQPPRHRNFPARGIFLAVSAVLWNSTAYLLYESIKDKSFEDISPWVLLGTVTGTVASAAGIEYIARRYVKKQDQV